MIETLKRLVDTFGPSGNEEPICAVIKEEIKGYADEIFTDNLGNLIAVRKGKKPSIMLAAHMDEVGVIVTHIDEKGFLRIAPVGSPPLSQLPGQRVVFADGVIGVIYHEKLKSLKELDWNKLYLDIGSNDQEEVKKKVKVGDMAVPCYPVAYLGKRFTGKALDNRAGCAVLIEVMRRLPKDLPKEVVFVFTVQEELGTRGAKTSAYAMEPGMGIAVDVTPAGDTPESPRMSVSLGKGPAVKIKDSSVIAHPLVKDLMIRVAEESNIPYQYEVLERGGTDAGAISLSRDGVPTGALSIPCRYVHSSSEMVDLGDMEGAVELLVEIIKVPT